MEVMRVGVGDIRGKLVRRWRQYFFDDDLEENLFACTTKQTRMVWMDRTAFFDISLYRQRGAGYFSEPLVEE